MVIGSKELIRDINNAAVLETIVKDAPVSRVDIAKGTGLTKGTISTITQNLLDMDLIVETGLTGNGIGRKSTMLMLNDACGYSVTIDIEQKRLRLLACDICGQKAYFEKKAYTEPFDIVKEIKLLIDNCLLNLPESAYGVIGISLSIDGIVRNNNIVSSPFSQLLKCRLKEELYKEYGLPIFIYNKSNFGVIGENIYSMRTKNIALINADSSISMGLITENRLFCGSNGQACDLGHMVVEISGKPCSCGRNGCLEQYASLSSLLGSLSNVKSHEISFDKFCHLFNTNDYDAHNAVKLFIKYMSCGIKNIISLYNPEIIVINSPLTIYFDEIFLRLKLSLGKNKGILYRSMLKDDAPLYGGTVIAVTNFLKIESFTPSMCYFNNMKIL